LSVFAATRSLVCLRSRLYLGLALVAVA